VPYGATHGVPFHALYDGERYLVERHVVSVCPSSSLVDLCARRTRRSTRTALVIAYSDGGLLPGVLDEARAISALLPGECYVEEQATRAALGSAVARHGVIHLAGHAESRPDNPTFAYVKLADGQLSAGDVFDL